MIKKVTTIIAPAVRNLIKKNPQIERSRGFRVATIITTFIVDRMRQSENAIRVTEKPIYTTFISGLFTEKYFQTGTTENDWVWEAFCTAVRVEGIVLGFSDNVLHMEISFFKREHKVASCKLSIYIDVKSGDVNIVGSTHS